MALVTCKDLSLSYGRQPVVRGINCTIGEGDYLCVVGGNGSGKTSFILGILGLIKIAAGHIELGQGLSLQDIGYLPQQSTIQRNFPATVKEVVMSGRLSRLGRLPFYRREDKLSALKTLELLEISDLASQPFSSLSGGQQQRVLLARALCATHDGLKILILDEPMNGLDPHMRHDLYDTILDLNRSLGISILMVTHDVQMAVSFASHILLLEGKQEFFGTTHEFEHTAIGQQLIRDSCGGNCQTCGIRFGDER